MNSGHDTDSDEMIDGLELYKAIHHAKSHKESHDHTLHEHSPPGVPTMHQEPSEDSFVAGSEDLGAIGIKVFIANLKYKLYYHENNM